jgi:dethiobiotin synthetase
VAALADQLRRVARTRAPDVLLVEGAGGWLVPLNDTETLADLAVALQATVVLVVAMRLGCLNHALLTAESIAARGLCLGGWVANSVQSPMPVLEENIAALERRLPGLRLGSVPWLGATPAPQQVALWLDGAPLWSGRS